MGRRRGSYIFQNMPGLALYRSGVQTAEVAFSIFLTDEMIAVYNYVY